MADAYLEALENEMNTVLPSEKNKVRTIYIGGGTPTAINKQQLQNLLAIINHKFDVKNCEEFTIEVNPGDIDEEKTKLLKMYGVTRISFGVQVMDDRMLKKLGRLHRVSDVYHTVDLLRKHSFSNISLDLIYALPHQTVKQFKTSLVAALELGLPHYATYGLQIEPKTVFYQRSKKGILHRPPEGDQVRMYEILKDSMERYGVRQYEISNFAKPGYESKHNLTYWSNGFYYGFGAGAHAYLPGKRIANIRALTAYIKRANQDGQPVLEVDKISIREQIEEEMFLGLRRVQGINKKEFEDKFGISTDELYKDEINNLIRKGWLTQNDQAIRLTNEGMLLENKVFQEFILEEDFELNQL